MKKVNYYIISSIIGVLSISYGIFLVIFVFLKLSKFGMWNTMLTLPIIVIPQFIIGMTFLIGGVGVLLKKNKARLLLVISGLTKILFAIAYINFPITYMPLYIKSMGRDYPFGLIHDMLSTLFSILVIIILSNNRVIEIFLKSKRLDKEICRSRVIWYGVVIFLLLISQIYGFYRKILFYDSFGFWIIVFLIWPFIVNLTSIRNAKGKSGDTIPI